MGHTAWSDQSGHDLPYPEVRVHHAATSKRNMGSEEERGGSASWRKEKKDCRRCFSLSGLCLRERGSGQVFIIYPMPFLMNRIFHCLLGVCFFQRERRTPFDYMGAYCREVRFLESNRSGMRQATEFSFYYGFCRLGFFFSWILFRWQGLTD